MLRRLCYVTHAQACARQSQRWCHGLSHVSKDGASPRMVDVGSKQVTRRTARAQAIVHLPTHVSEALLPPSHTKGDAVRELVGPKVSAHVVLSTKGCYNAVKAGRRTHLDWIVCCQGPIFTTATIAGVMAAKRTSELIPFCHPLPLDSCNIDVCNAPSWQASTKLP